MAMKSYKLKKVNIPKSAIKDMAAVRITLGAFGSIKKGIRKAIVGTGKAIATGATAVYNVGAKAMANTMAGVNEVRLNNLEPKIEAVVQGLKEAKNLNQEYKSLEDPTLREHKQINKTRKYSKKLFKKLQKYIDKHERLESKIFGASNDLKQAIDEQNIVRDEDIEPVEMSAEQVSEVTPPAPVAEQRIETPAPVVVEAPIIEQPIVAPVVETPVQTPAAPQQPVVGAPANTVDYDSLSFGELKRRAQEGDKLATEVSGIRTEKEAAEKLAQGLATDNKAKDDQIKALEEKNSALDKDNKDKDGKLAERDTKIADFEKSVEDINSKLNRILEELENEKSLRKAAETKAADEAKARSDAEKARDDAQTKANKMSESLETIKNAIDQATKTAVEAPVQVQEAPKVEAPVNQEPVVPQFGPNGNMPFVGPMPLPVSVPFSAPETNELSEGRTR